MPNVVLLHSHDTGRYLAPYGHPVPTPNLAELAEESVTFRDAHCAGPTCSPSRAALFTGRSPHANGMLGLAHRGFSLNDYDQHLVRFLGRNGFETALAGFQHEAFGEDWDDRDRVSREQVGYDRVLTAGDDQSAPVPDALDDVQHDGDVRAAAEAAAFLRDRSAAADGDAGNSFFLSVGLSNPHRAFREADPVVDPDRVRPPDPIPDTPETRREMAGYATSAWEMDACAGVVLDALRETGALDDTIVIYTTDHGIAYKDMKCNLYSDGTGVALLLRLPNGDDRLRGACEDALVSHIDLFPTLCDELGLAHPDWLEGTSLTPLLDGAVDAVREEIFSEVTYHAAYEPKRCVRTDRYLYIRRFGEYDRYVLPNIDKGAHKELLMDAGLGDRKRPREALYDTLHDPQERDNRIADPDYADVRDGLRNRLEDWMRRTDDPLLDGPVPKPDGARITVQDAPHPGTDAYEEPGIRGDD